MKNTRRNAVILVFACCFAALSLFGELADAQTRSSKSAKATPTPKSKKSPAATAKATPKPKAKATPTPKTASNKSKTDTKSKTADKSKTDSKSKPATTKTTAKNNKVDKTASSSKTKPTTAKNNKSTAKTEKPATKPEKSTTKPKTEKVAAKPAPETKPKTVPDSPPSSTVLSQIIVAAPASRIRQQPRDSATQTGIAPLGKILNVTEENGGFYRVEYAKGKSGWIAKTTVKDYANDERDDIYKDIAEKYGKGKSLDFAAASEVADFLRTAQPSVKKDDLKAELGLKRLRVLGTALKSIPTGKSDLFPYRNFIRANEKDIVYSEPSGEWYVRSDLFWELHGKYTATPIAEEIAWDAAQNPIPGECEGYVNCYLYMLRATSGEYLNFYPNGKYSKKALSNITDMLAPIVADVNAKSVYAAPNDISDRAEFNRFLTELRTIISKMPDVDKAKTLQQITQLGEGYK